MGFSAYIAVAVTDAAVFSGALMEVEQMHQALASRAVIEQAKGIVMAQLSCSADDAFAALRSRSNHDNRKLHDIARAIVDQVQPSPPSLR